MNRDGLILASTDVARPIGADLRINGTGPAPACGDSESTVVTHDGHYAIVGRSTSQGYREFKGADGYRDDVIAVVVETFGGIRDITARSGREIRVIEDQRTDLPSAEFATFFVDGELFAIDAEAVSEAIPAARIGALSMGARHERLGVLELDPAVHSSPFVWVFDLGAVLTGKRSTPTASAQVIIVSHGTHKIGLLVSELHGVSKFARRAIAPSPLALLDETMLVRQVIQANQGEMLIQVIDPELLFALFKECAFASEGTVS
jgi:chemotaxis signal transduction protein